MLRSNDDIFIVMADHDTAFLRRMEEAFRKEPAMHIVALAQSGEDALARCREMSPDVLIVEYSMPDMQAPDIVREIPDVSPGTLVFAVAVAVSATLRATAVHNYSIQEIWDKRYIDMEQMIGEIRARVERAREESTTHAQKHGYVLPGTGPYNKATAQHSARAPIVKQIKQATILVQSPKGGVGKTTVASNLAVALKMSPVLQGWNVVIVDADTEFSNLAAAMGMSDVESCNHIGCFDLVDENISQSGTEEMLYRHRSGVFLLPAPHSPAMGSKVTISQADKAFRILRKYFGVIVIDGGPKLPNAVQAALGHATDVVLLVEPEIQSVENVQRLMGFLGAVNQDHLFNKMRLVLNKVVPGERTDLGPREIARITRMPVTRIIPMDTKTVRNPRHSGGRLAVEAHPDSPFSFAIRQLANDIMNAYPGISAKQRNKEERQGFFGRIFSRNG